MSLDICTMFSAGSLLSSGFQIGWLLWLGTRHCLLSLAPVYLPDLCCPLLSALSSRSFCSSQQGFLLVPFTHTSSKQSHAFPMVGLSTWNSLPSELPIFLRALSPVFFLTLRLLLLAMLELEPMSSFLEEALYKCSI